MTRCSNVPAACSLNVTSVTSSKSVVGGLDLCTAEGVAGGSQLPRVLLSNGEHAGTTDVTQHSCHTRWNVFQFHKQQFMVILIRFIAKGVTLIDINLIAVSLVSCLQTPSRVALLMRTAAAPTFSATTATRPTTTPAVVG